MENTVAAARRIQPGTEEGCGGVRHYLEYRYEGWSRGTRAIGYCGADLGPANPVKARYHSQDNQRDNLPRCAACEEEARRRACFIDRAIGLAIAGDTTLPFADVRRVAVERGILIEGNEPPAGEPCSELAFNLGVRAERARGAAEERSGPDWNPGWCKFTGGVGA